MELEISRLDRYEPIVVRLPKNGRYQLIAGKRRVSRDRGSRASRKAEELFYKFIEQVELIFNNLSMPLKWLSFLLNNLVLLTSIPLTVHLHKSLKNQKNIRPDH